MHINKIAFFIRPGLLVCLLLAIVGCSTSTSNQATPTPIAQLLSTQQVTFKVTRGPIEEEEDITGQVTTAEQDQLYFRTSGVVDQVNIKSGDTFKKGDILAQLQTTDLQTQLQQAEINLQVAQDNLANDKLQRDFNLQNAEANVVIAEENVDLAQIALSSAKGNEVYIDEDNLKIAQERLYIAEAQLTLVKGQTSSDLQKVYDIDQLTVQSLQQQITDRQLVAPYDGIVLYTNLKAGTSVKAFDDSVALVGDPSQLVIQSAWDNTLATEMTANTSVSLYLNQDTSKLYPVHYTPQFLPLTSQSQGITTGTTNTITVNYLYFSLPTDMGSTALKVGSAVDLKIILGSKQDALLLPPAAIRGNDTFKYVIVLADSYHRRVEVVSIGLQTTQEWEVISPDLKEGDVVLGPDQ